MAQIYYAMKFTLIGPVYPFRGGISHYTAMLSRALQHTGNEVQVVSFRRQYPAFLYPGKTDKDPSQNPIKVNAVYPLDPLYPWTWLRSAHEIIAGQPDGVIFQWWTTFWAVPFAVLARRFRKSGIPIIFIIHNVIPHEPRPWDVWLARRALTDADRFIVQNPKEEQLLRGLIHATMIQHCEHPVYSFFNSIKLSKDEARLRLNLPQDRFLLLFFGLVRPYKGLDALLEALARLGAAGTRPFLVIAGEFWEDLEKTMQKISVLGLQPDVRIDNRYIPDEEVGIYFSAADCLVAPYIGGTQSGAVSIGTSFGLPMIVTTHIAQGIRPGANKASVFVIPPGDAEALSSAIEEAVKAPQTPALQQPSNSDWDQLAQILMGILEE